MSEGSNTVGDIIVASHSGPLAGEVIVPGAKNSVLKLMAATLLADGRYLLTNALSSSTWTSWPTFSLPLACASHFIQHRPVKWVSTLRLSTVVRLRPSPLLN